MPILILLVGMGALVLAFMKVAKESKAFSEEAQPVAVTFQNAVDRLAGTPDWWVYDSTIFKWSTIYKVDPAHVKSFLIVESLLGTDERVRGGEVSRDGLSYGIAQFINSTASRLLGRSATVADLNDANTSIRLCAQYYSENLGKFPQSPMLAVMAYNMSIASLQDGKRVPEYWNRWNYSLNKVKEMEE